MAFSARNIFPILVLAAFTLLLLPATAFASYSNPSVNTVAQMRTDGSLFVAEQRSFDFEEEYSILTWAFTGLTSDAEIDIEAVRLAQLDREGNVTQDWKALERVSFQPAWREFVQETEGETKKVASALAQARERSENTSDDISLPPEGTYAFDERRGLLYVFITPTTELVTIECNYLASDAALLYDDLAELYWDYVDAKEDVETSSVRVQLQLPVPEGVQVVPGDNVMAWGHGPAGTVNINADGTIDFAVDEVLAGQYAQAHVAFPVGWLSNLTVKQKLDKSGLRRDDVVKQESSWVDSYSASKINGYVMDIALLALCMVALAIALVLYAAFGREPRPREWESREAAAGALSRYDRAVVGRLLRWNQLSAADFPATLEQLAHKGVISIDCSSQAANVNGINNAISAGQDERGARRFDSVRFKVTPGAKNAPLDAIERGAMELVFDRVGDGYQSVSLGEMRAWCVRNVQAASKAMSAWQDDLTAAVSKAALFDARSRKIAKWLAVAAAAFIVVGLYMAVASRELSQAFAFGCTGVLLAVVTYNTPARTQLGSDLEAAAACAGRDNSSESTCTWQEEMTELLEDVVVRDGGDNTRKSRRTWVLVPKRTTKTT